MFTIYTKANRLMSANQFTIEGKSIICNDVNLPENIEHSYNPHNVRLWLIGHFHGPVCAIFASNEQDAIDEACDALLWSQRAIELCLCSDCEDIDSDTLTDLENKLESLLKD